jgi:hypothetical protein
MTDKSKDINIVDLSKKREEAKKEREKIPEPLIEKLRKVVQKAEEDKIRSLVLNFDYETEEDEEDDGSSGTMFFNKTQSPLEIIGVIEVMKSQAFHMLFVQDDCDEE